MSQTLLHCKPGLLTNRKNMCNCRDGVGYYRLRNLFIALSILFTVALRAIFNYIKLLSIFFLVLYLKRFQNDIQNWLSKTTVRNLRSFCSIFVFFKTFWSVILQVTPYKLLVQCQVEPNSQKVQKFVQKYFYDIKVTLSWRSSQRFSIIAFDQIIQELMV